jgi:hypothetical protein
MSHWMRWCATATAVVPMLTGILLVAVTVQAPGVSEADVCASVGGRRGHVSVSGCADLADVMAPYVPPPCYYAPMPGDPPECYNP